MTRFRHAFSSFFNKNPLPGLLLCLVAVLAPTPAFCAGGHLRLLVPPVENATIMYSRFKPLADYLSHAVKQPITLVLSKNLDDFLTKAREDVPQIVYFCPLNYVKMAHEMLFYPLAGVALKGGGDRSVIVVRRDSPVRTLQELKGKSLALGNVTCASSYLVPRTMLLHAGIGLGDFLEVRNTGSDQAALMAVAARLYDVTATGEDAAAPFIQKALLRPLAYSPLMPSDLIAADASVSPRLRERIKRALLRLKGANAAPAAVAIKPNAVGFIPVQDRNYDIIRTMEQRISGAHLRSRAVHARYSAHLP